jgi:hypothetical protein
MREMLRETWPTTRGYLVFAAVALIAGVMAYAAVSFAIWAVKQWR